MLSTEAAERSAPAASRSSRTPWIAAAIVLVVALLVALAALYPRLPADAPARLSIAVPGIITPQSAPAISPDGRQIAFVTTSASGQSTLWLRAFDSDDPRELPGTANAAHPFWSPDGKWLAFMSEGKLKKVPADGGPVQVLAERALHLRFSVRP